MTVTDRRGRVAGRIRRTSPGFTDRPRWVVEGVDHSFAGSLDAMKYLLKRNEGMKFQVKTALSHRYWTGKGWSSSRDEGRIYRTEGKAEIVAANLAVNGNEWDKVVVVSWVEDNWDCP